MLRLSSRRLGKQATSPTTNNYICQRCLQSARWAAPSSNPLRNPNGSPRSYHATAISLQYQRYGERSGGYRDGGRRRNYGDDDMRPYTPRKRYGGPRKYKQAEDEYPDEVSDSIEFDQSRFQIDGGVVGRAAEQSVPDLQAIMSKARDSDFSRKLQKLRREEAEKRDQSLRILANLERPNTFEESSLRPVVKKALAKAYPNMQRLSQTQKNMMVLLQEGYSLCATGPAGSGKSFISALWLLQMARSMSVVRTADWGTKKVPTTTGIIFVPTIDLMKQYTDMLDNLVSAFVEPGQPGPPKDSIFQGFTRLSQNQSEAENEQLQRLKENPSPHIIVTTPTRFLDILNDPEAKNNLNLDNLKVIIADEVDAMITQRPTPKKVGDLVQQKRIRNERRWAKPSPMETCVDFLISKREMMASQRGKQVEPIQFCCISPNLSPILKTKLTVIKNWVGFSKVDSKANQMLNLGIQDFSKLFDHQKIGHIVKIPDRIKHYALSVDITTGMMRDIPEFEHDPLIRSQDEQAEIEKYVNILRTHHDPRVGLLSKEALALEAAQENILMEEEGSLTKYNYSGADGADFEVKDLITELANDFRHTSIPKRITVEILDTLLRRDNYPERAIVFLTPTASRPQYIAALQEAGYNAESLRADICEAHGVQLGRSDIPPPPKSEEGRARTKADTMIWVASAAGVRGLDTPYFTHAYIMVPTTGYQKYSQMAGRIARYPYPKQTGKMEEPTGQVTTIFLEEPVGDHQYAPMIDGVVQIDSPVEGLAWRRIYRMYGLCGAKVEKYFGEGEENGVMLRSVESHTAKFPDMEEELPWEEGTDTSSKDPALAPLEKQLEESAFEFLPLEGEVSQESLLTAEERTAGTDVVEDDIEFEDSFEPLTMKDDSDSAPTDSEAVTSSEVTTETSEVAAEEITPEEEAIESETREDENDPEDSPSIYEPVDLQDGPYFIPEDAPDPENPIKAQVEPTPVPSELQGISEVPLELGDGITEEEAKEFQAAQDDIFSAFLELNSIQEKIRQAKEANEVEESEESEESDDSESGESSSDSDDDFGEIADGDYEGVQHRSVPAKENSKY